MAQDYTRYSLAELHEALGIVDGRRYPENKAAIEAEIQARIDSGAYAEEEQAEEKQQAATARKKIDFARKAKPYILGTVVSGVAILKGRGWGSTLAIGLLCVQLVEITSSVFNMKALSALGFYVSFTTNGDIGFSADFQPGVTMALGTPQPLTIGVNLFVVWLIYLLVKATEDRTD